jgi:transposase
MKTSKAFTITLDEDIKEYPPFLRVKKVKDKAYLYEITQFYNKRTKKRWQSSKYIRKIDPQEDLNHLTKEAPAIPMSFPCDTPKIQQVISFGDAYLFQSLVEELHLKEILLKCFSTSMTHFLLLAVGYKLLGDGQAFQHMESWLESSELSSFYPLSASFHSASISKYLARLGKDETEAIARFFLHWSQQVTHQGESLLFDLTSFSTQAVDIEEAEYGYSKDHTPYPQLNMGLLTNQQQKLPMYYKIYPGSLKDVTTLHNMVEEIRLLSIPEVLLILDRGFYKEQHLLEMLQHELAFLLPLSRIHRSLYDSIRTRHRAGLESASRLIIVNGKPYYASNGEVTIPFSKSFSETLLSNKKTSPSFPLYYAIYLDPERKQSEAQHFLIELVQAEELLRGKDWKKLLEDAESKDPWKELAGSWKTYLSLQHNPSSGEYEVQRQVEAVDQHLQTLGITILLSSSPRDAATLLTLYRQRDQVEKVFDSTKNELRGLPLRVHQSDTMKGYFFVLFLEMIVQNYLLYKMKEGKVDPKYSVRRVFFELHKLKSVLWFGKDSLRNEITKLQQTLFQQLGIVMPN